LNYGVRALMPSEQKYRKDIQALRGVAILSVLFFHANENYFPAGYLGVDVFFVISGFVVTPLILRMLIEKGKSHNGLSNLWGFYIRRFYRLAPALGVTLVISGIAVLLVGPITDHQRIASQGIATLLLAGNLGAYRYSGDYFSPSPNPLVHTWSLSVEEQIYIFLPLILLLGLWRYRRIKKGFGILLTVIAVISFMSFLFPDILLPLYGKLGIQLANQFSFYSPIDRIWQFILGGLGFLLLDKYQHRVKIVPTKMHLILLMALIVLLFGPMTLSLKASSIAASVLALGIIYFRSLNLISSLINQKLEWIGNRSYSIYLVHMPLLYIAKVSPLIQIGQNRNHFIQIVIASAGSIILGSLSYSKIENRFRNRGTRESTGFKTTVIAAVFTITIPLIFFTAMYSGYQHRYWGLERNVPQPPYAGALDSNCERDSEAGPLCAYPENGSTKTVLLIGDSHAGHISQAVIDAAKSKNWNTIIWTHRNCPVQFTRDSSGGISENCLSINRKMLNWVSINKPNAIILSEYVHSNSSISDLIRALEGLHSVIPKILLIQNNPIFPDDKDFMSRRPLLMSPYKPPEYFSQEYMQTKDRNASDALASSASHLGIATLDVSHFFCSEGICRRFSGGVWLYLDVGHLSVAGGSLLIPQLEIILDQFE
jgi:peptidoglycan/LPS O-acetylase OafA/YrhL